MKTQNIGPLASPSLWNLFAWPESCTWGGIEGNLVDKECVVDKLTMHETVKALQVALVLQKYTKHLAMYT